MGAERGVFILREDNKLKVKIHLFWDMTPCGLLNNFGDLGRIADSIEGVG